MWAVETNGRYCCCRGITFSIIEYDTIRYRVRRKMVILLNKYHKQILFNFQWFIKRLIWISAICVVGTASIANSLYDRDALYHPVIAQKGMVVTEEVLATQVGIDILKQGGNAIDAACAIGYALAVTLPKAGNIGGGGFMMVYLKESDTVVAVDYREKAPEKSTKTMFWDADGNVDPNKSRYSGLSVGVPGTVAGLEAVHKKYGRLSREAILKPAITLAKKGFKVSYELSDSLARAKTRLKKHDQTRQTFYPNGNPLVAGTIIKQPELAKTLSRILAHGESGFYEGKTAKNIVDYVQKQGGILSLSDLKSYRPVFRAPVEGRYKQSRIVSMPPPSSGGIAIIEALNILEETDIHLMMPNSADYIHTISNTLKYVYRDRALYLGDTDFVEVPSQRLMSKDYARRLAETITTDSILKVEDTGVSEPVIESDETTHYVVVDADGNAVSNTYTLNFSYGNGMVVPKAGFFLNNEMDDFSAKPGVPNAYGLVGNKQNEIAPHKRMLSSMSPTFVFKGKDLFLVTGSPGGSRIITTVLHQLLNTLEYNMGVAESVYQPRFHHQWKPQEIFLEQGFSSDTVTTLQKRLFSIKTTKSMGAAETIMIKNGYLHGVADPRKPNSLALGY